MEESKVCDDEGQCRKSVAETKCNLESKPQSCCPRGYGLMFSDEQGRLLDFTPLFYATCASLLVRASKLQPISQASWGVFSLTAAQRTNQAEQESYLPLPLKAECMQKSASSHLSVWATIHMDGLCYFLGCLLCCSFSLNTISHPCSHSS